MRATMFPLRSFGPSTCTSLAGKPASSKRLAMAWAAIVVLPTESVVLISTSCLKMSRASCLVVSFSCACSVAAKKKLAISASANTDLDFNLFSLRKGTNEPSRPESPRSKWRRGEGRVFRRFETGNGEAVQLQFGDVAHGAGVENLAEGRVHGVRPVFRQQSEKLAETILGFGILGGFFGGQRAVSGNPLFVPLVELIAKLLLVKRGVGGFLRPGPFIRRGEGRCGEIIQRLLKVAEVSRRAHQRSSAALAQRRSQLVGARVVAFAVNIDRPHGYRRGPIVCLRNFLLEVRDPCSRSHLQNLRAAKHQPVGIGSFARSQFGLREADRCKGSSDQQR